MRFASLNEYLCMHECMCVYKLRSAPVDGFSKSGETSDVTLHRGAPGENIKRALLA